MVVIKLYLLAYNAICCIVWSFILYEAIKTIYSQRTLGMSWDVVAQKTWNQVGTPLKWIQAAAVLEIVHAAIGFVRSSAGSAVMQGKLYII
jgi:very-long-chain (3R)-3-hydroxyacyl-CoA dehydratase